MFADPSVVTINAVAKNLVRINQDQYSSEYMLRSSTDEIKLTIRNSSYFNKKTGVGTDRHNVELVQTVFPVAPATQATTRKAYVVIENQRGDDLTANTKFAAGLLAFLTEANITKLFGYES
jgi:hypothetical protein